MTCIRKLNPTVSRHWLLLLAGGMWSAVGIMLLWRASGWLLAMPPTLGITLGLLGVLFAFLSYRFSAIAKGTGIKEIRIPFCSPNANAICDRFVGTLRRECLDQIVILNQRHLHVVTREFVTYYNTGRPHQGIGLAIPIPLPDQPDSGMVVAMPVPGGLHHDCRRAA